MISSMQVSSVRSVSRAIFCQLGASATVPRCVGRQSIATKWFSSNPNTENITYSGGQASVGQGGFYGSGGARVLPADQQQYQQQTNERNKMLALAHDVQTIRTTMMELEKLESLLRGEEASSSSGMISSKRMEIKNSIKKLMTAPNFIESLNNVEVQGEPAWGLSREERELIITARSKVNEC